MRMFHVEHSHLLKNKVPLVSEISVKRMKSPDKNLRLRSKIPPPPAHNPPSPAWPGRRLPPASRGRTR